MNKSFLIIIIILLGGNVFSQNIKQDIQEIREQFKWINSQKKFVKVVLENEEFKDNIPSEGCGLVGYYKNGKLYKIIEQDIVSMASYTNEYYLKDDKLIFVFRKEVEYSEPFSSDDNLKTKTTYEERVYYKDGKIIRHLEKNKSILSKKLDFQNLFKQYKILLDTKVKYEKEYNLLQGTWRNVDDNDDWYTIMGLKKDQYYKADIQDVCRFWFEGRYFYYHCVEENTTIRYELLHISKNKFEIQNMLEGNVEVYERIED